jgi:hypothetical protein
MSSAEPGSRPVMFLAIILQDFNLEAAYLASEKIASEHGGKFNGIFPYTLQPSPLIVLSNLNFLLKLSEVNVVARELQSTLKVMMKFQIIPHIQQEKPLPSGMIG